MLTVAAREVERDLSRVLPGFHPSRVRLRPSLLTAARLAVAVAAGLAVVVLGAVPRILTAVQMDSLNDETVFVDWLGQWFSQHALEYLLQLQHTTYPPMSPVFANPPLFPFLVGISLNIGNWLLLPPLLAGRMVSVLAGLLTCGIVTWTGRRMWGPGPGLLAGAIFAMLPVAVVGSASAYVEGLLALTVAVVLASMVEHERSRGRASLLLAAVVSGFGILTKLPFIPFVLGTVLAIIAIHRNSRTGFRYAVIYLSTTALVPIVTWAGARDIKHIQAVYQYVTALRPNDGLTQRFPDQTMAIYYPSMVLGTLPDVVALLLLGGLAYLGYSYASGRPIDRWVLVILGLISTYSAFVTITVGASSRHQIVALQPLIALICAWFIWTLARRLSHNTTVQAVLAVAALIGSALPVLTTPPGEYNAFSNMLVGGTRGSLRFYLSGDGEGIRKAAEWINANTPAGTVIATVAQDYNLQRYLADGRRAVPLYNRERMDAAGARGASIILLYASQVLGGSQTPMSESATQQRPWKEVTVGGAPYIFLYNPASQPRQIRPISFDWTSFQKSSTGEAVSLSTNGGVTGIKYQFLGSGLHWAGLISSPFSLTGVDRLALTIDSRTVSGTKPVYVDLMPGGSDQGTGYMRYILPLPALLAQGTARSLDLEIPLDMFKWVDEDGSPAPNPGMSKNMYQLRLVVDSREPTAGRLEVSGTGTVTVGGSATVLP